VTPDLHFGIAQQGGCCFIAEAVLVLEHEVGCVHAARLAGRPRGVVVMSPPLAVVIAVRDLLQEEILVYISRESRGNTSFL